MRLIPSEMQAALAAGVTTHCTAWRVARADGAVFGFTDHDRPLTFDGVEYRPGAGFGGTELAGALDDVILTEADIEAGLWDGAEVQVWRVDWRSPSQGVRLRIGRLGAIERQGGVFRTELIGLAAGLDKTLGRVFSRRCDAALGDARCGMAANHPAFAEGCDGRWTTCRDRFDNTLNFRGFPHLIGNDALLAAPGAEARPDGSSRDLTA